jgi:hypothetical protein
MNTSTSYYSDIFSSSVTSIVNSNSDFKNTSFIQQWFHPLNKSTNKYICIGLSVEDFSSLIKLSGNVGYSIILTEDEWREILVYQGVITNNLYLSASNLEPLMLGSIKLYFEKIHDKNVLKIQKNGYYIYLGEETVCNLWQLIPLIEKRLTLLKNQQFKQYFSIFKNNYANDRSDIINKIFEVLTAQENASENVCTIMELLISHPTILEDKIRQK